MIEQVRKTLTNYGNIGVQAIKADVNKISATNKTADSIRFEVTDDKEITKLTYYARKFFSLLESGRGPRKSSTDGGFKDEMYEYMIARGIGADLSEKKRKQLARFLVLKINREGDATYKKGGRVVYTPTITKLVQEITAAIKKDLVGYYVKDVLSVVKDGNNGN